MDKSVFKIQGEELFMRFATTLTLAAVMFDKVAAKGAEVFGVVVGVVGVAVLAAGLTMVFGGKGRWRATAEAQASFLTLGV